jgi:REP element-mobilizing transposase RayT
MTRGLERWYGGHDLHFITCSCYRRRPQLDSGERRDLFLPVLERARQKYRFVVIGYVVMPEHFHLLITEPEVGNPSVVMKVVKERFTRLLHHGGMAHRPDLAKAFLRLQCVQYGKAHREATLHPSQPGEAMSGRQTRRLEMEQLPHVCLRRRGLGKSELSGMAAHDNVVRRPAICLPFIGRFIFNSSRTALKSLLGEITPKPQGELCQKSLRTCWI